MAFKNGKNQPRNRSTNTRSLSNRITNIQREINPCIQMTGVLPSGAQKFYVTRKVTSIVPIGTGNGGTYATPSNLGVVDGAKILSLSVSNITGRTLSVNVPYGSIILVNNGNTTAPFGGLQKTVTAPLSRFPTIRMNIPDVMAAPLNADSTEPLFIMNGGPGETSTYFRVTYTAKYLA